MLVCCSFISGRKRRITRIVLYVLLVPASFCIGVAISGLLLVLDTIATIIQYVTKIRTHISKSINIHVQQNKKRMGEKNYIWVCFRFSIDGVGRYYECSVQMAFWMELLPIMVRYEKSISS